MIATFAFPKSPHIGLPGDISTQAGLQRKVKWKLVNKTSGPKTTAATTSNSNIKWAVSKTLVGCGKIGGYTIK